MRPTLLLDQERREDARRLRVVDIFDLSLEPCPMFVGDPGRLVLDDDKLRELASYLIGRGGKPMDSRRTAARPEIIRTWPARVIRPKSG